MPASVARSAERRDVVRRVACAAGDDLGGVVLENQHRRLARHAVHFAVDELVRDEIADDQHATAAEVVDERQQDAPCVRLRRATGGRSERSSMALGFGFRLQASGFGRSLAPEPIVFENPAGRFDQIVHDGIGGQSVRRPCSSSAPYPVRTSTPRPPMFRASATSSHRSPTVNDSAGFTPSSRDRAVDQAATGLAAIARDGVLSDRAVADGADNSNTRRDALRQPPGGRRYDDGLRRRRLP